jgi:hypothetical protein
MAISPKLSSGPEVSLRTSDGRFPLSKSSDVGTGYSLPD